MTRTMTALTAVCLLLLALVPTPGGASVVGVRCSGAAAVDPAPDANGWAGGFRATDPNSYQNRLLTVTVGGPLAGACALAPCSDCSPGVCFYGPQQDATACRDNGVRWCPVYCFGGQAAGDPRGPVFLCSHTRMPGPDAWGGDGCPAAPAARLPVGVVQGAGGRPAQAAAPGTGYRLASGAGLAFHNDAARAARVSIVDLARGQAVYTACQGPGAHSATPAWRADAGSYEVQWSSGSECGVAPGSDAPDFVRDKTVGLDVMA